MCNPPDNTFLLIMRLFEPQPHEYVGRGPHLSGASGRFGCPSMREAAKFRLITAGQRRLTQVR